MRSTRMRRMGSVLRCMSGLLLAIVGLQSVANAVDCPTCPTFASISQSVFPSPNIIVGSPLGNLGTYTVIYKDNAGQPLPGIAAWMSEHLEFCTGGEGARLLAGGLEPLFCGQDAALCAVINWPYIEGTTDGSGSVTVNVRVVVPGGSLRVARQATCWPMWMVCVGLIKANVCGS